MNEKSPVFRFPLVVRPGALGDAVLTLPLLRALRSSGAERLLVAGTPASWRFLLPAAAAVVPSLRVEDIGSPAWMGLFAADISFPPRTSKLLRSISGAFVFLKTGTEPAAAALRAAGVRYVRTAAPPTAAGTTKTYVAKKTGAAVKRRKHLLLEERHAAEELLRAWMPARERQPEENAGPFPPAGLPDNWTAEDEPWLRPTMEERAKIQVEALDKLRCIRLGAGPFPAPGVLLRRPPAPAPRSGADGGLPLAVLHPGAGGRGKCFPPALFAGLAAWLFRVRGLLPVLLHGPADAEAAAAVQALLPGNVPVWRWKNRSLREGATLLDAARVFVGNDSGLSHLAARFVPTVVLFGPTRAAVWRPRGPWVFVVNAPGGDMRRVSLAAVARAVERMLLRGRERTPPRFFPPRFL